MRMNNNILEYIVIIYSILGALFTPLKLSIKRCKLLFFHPYIKENT